MFYWYIDQSCSNKELCFDERSELMKTLSKKKTLSYRNASLKNQGLDWIHQLFHTLMVMKIGNPIQLKKGALNQRMGTEF